MRFTGSCGSLVREVHWLVHQLSEVHGAVDFVYVLVPALHALVHGS